MTHHDERVLAVHPIVGGFGWVVFEGPERPVDWGTIVVSGNRKARLLRRIEALVERWLPACLVMESLDGQHSRHSQRVREFGRSVAQLAAKNNIFLRRYARDEIQREFAQFDARTRYEIACVVAARIKPLAHELPPKRKIWLPENPRMGFFSAAAVAIAHYDLTRPNTWT